MVKLEWKGDLRFQAVMPDGTGFMMDSETAGPSPVQTLAAAVAACAGMDVVSILLKQRQNVTGYRLEVDYERPPEGQYPRPITSMVVRHILEGADIAPSAVERAIQLSDEKYCSVMATLREGPEMKSEYRLVEPSAAK
jgi:putative redox protein